VRSQCWDDMTGTTADAHFTVSAAALTQCTGACSALLHCHLTLQIDQLHVGVQATLVNAVQ
jgi:hypothetical protein